MWRRLSEFNTCERKRGEGSPFGRESLQTAVQIWQLWKEDGIRRASGCSAAQRRGWPSQLGNLVQRSRKGGPCYHCYDWSLIGLCLGDFQSRRRPVTCAPGGWSPLEGRPEQQDAMATTDWKGDCARITHSPADPHVHTDTIGNRACRNTVVWCI